MFKFYTFFQNNTREKLYQICLSNTLRQKNIYSKKKKLCIFRLFHHKAIVFCKPINFSTFFVIVLKKIKLFIRHQVKLALFCWTFRKWFRVFVSPYITSSKQRPWSKLILPFSLLFRTKSIFVGNIDPRQQRIGGIDPLSGIIFCVCFCKPKQVLREFSQTFKWI